LKQFKQCRDTEHLQNTCYSTYHW